MSAPKEVAIVGASLAGATVATALREAGYDGASGSSAAKSSRPMSWSHQPGRPI